MRRGELNKYHIPFFFNMMFDSSLQTIKNVPHR